MKNPKSEHFWFCIHDVNMKSRVTGNSLSILKTKDKVFAARDNLQKFHPLFYFFIFNPIRSDWSQKSIENMRWKLFFLGFCVCLKKIHKNVTNKIKPLKTTKNLWWTDKFLWIICTQNIPNFPLAPQISHESQSKHSAPFEFNKNATPSTIHHQKTHYSRFIFTATLLLRLALFELFFCCLH